MPKTVNEKLYESYIRHSVYIEQLKAGEAKLISNYLNKQINPQIFKKLISELKKLTGVKVVTGAQKVPIKHLTRMLISAQKISAAGMSKIEGKLVDRLVDVSKFEAKWNKNLLEKTVPLDISLDMPNTTVLKTLVNTVTMDGHKLGTWMKGFSKTLKVSMMKQVKVGIATGESIRDIGKRIEGVLGYKSKQAGYIARTAVSSVVHQAREEVFTRNADLIKDVQWVSTLDDRTTLICINYDGRLLNEEGIRERPPAHFNCRSTVIPVTASWKEYGIKDPPPAMRASMTGTEAAKMNYKTWLRKQSKQTQIKVLGKTRAELYRSGRIKIDRFVNRDYKPLTLKQLARREGISLEEIKGKKLQALKRIEAMPVKASGAKLISIDKDILRKYSEGDFKNMVPTQLGGKFSAKFSPIMKKKMLENAKNLEKTLLKLNGYEGISYRGMTFANKVEKIKFLSKLKEGGIWQSKSFLATSKSESIAVEYAKLKAQNIIMVIKGKSGRDISRYWGASMKEVLFTKGTSFKVDKIVGNKVYLEEITKQAQLKSAPPITVSKVGTTFAKTTTKEVQDLVTKQINAYPEKVKIALNNNGVNYNIGNSLTEINPRLKGLHPAGWSKGATWDNVSGVYDMNVKSVSVAETYLPIGKKIYEVNSLNRIRRVLNHETGHAFDSTLGKGFNVYSNQKKFQQAYLKDIAKLSKADIVKNDLRFFMQEGVRGRSETFADVFGDIMGGGGVQGMSKFFPNCKKYIEDLLK